MIWPSTPMFHSPMRNVKSRPQAPSVSGIHTFTTWVILDQEPSDPLTIWQ